MIGKCVLFRSGGYNPAADCDHEFRWEDAGLYSDDIAYKVCKKCGKEDVEAYSSHLKQPLTGKEDV